jgi:hypothetical protein
MKAPDESTCIVGADPALSEAVTLPPMTRLLVAARFVWDEYPGLRAGRLYAGTGDVNRRPGGEAHLVEGPDAAETVCGLPRALFAYEFPWPDALLRSEPCTTCRGAAQA